MSESIKIRTSADIEAIEKRGFEAYLSSNTPFGLIEDTARARPDWCAELDSEIKLAPSVRTSWA